ncbi:uncharacterized protein LOC134805911 [Cydia splendana]|uniref:uncharacterized protein LOC134805911 n=1 Tax=Cydia splendana TaxID=1100963 RepID=UPI00300C9528
MADDKGEFIKAAREIYQLDETGSESDEEEPTPRIDEQTKLEHKVNQWKGALENGGLKLNVAKTEYMACGGTDPDPIKVGDDCVVKTNKFKYLGSVLHESGEIDHDVQARISAAWAKWREVTGVLCDPRIPVKLKGLVYKSIIRPVLLYGSETWPVLGRHVQQLHVTEMKMSLAPGRENARSKKKKKTM